MPRHAADPPPPPRQRRGPRVAAWVAGAAAVALAGSGIAYVLVNGPTLGRAADPASASPACADAELVEIAAAPEIQEAVRSFVVTLAQPSAGDCVRTQVVEAEPVDVVNGLSDPAATPDIWLPDSSLWVEEALAAGVELERVGSFGSSPVLVAADSESAGIAAWVEQPPSWPALLASGHGLAVPDPRTHAPTLLALAAARLAAQAAGPDPAVAKQLTAAATLAYQRSGVSSLEQGLNAADGPDSPILPVVVAGAVGLRQATAAVERPGIVEIAPVGGAPTLDYPVVVMSDERTPGAQRDVDAIAEALLSPAGAEVAAARGLDPPVTDPALLTSIPAADVETLAAELELFAKPSQILVVVDVSTSMLAEVSPGVTRAQVASQALGNALVLLPDSLAGRVLAVRLGTGRRPRLLGRPADHPARRTRRRDQRPRRARPGCDEPAGPAPPRRDGRSTTSPWPRCRPGRRPTTPRWSPRSRSSPTARTRTRPD